MMKTVMKAGPLNVLNIKRGDKTMLLLSFLITFGLFLVIILIASALVSDNAWLAISTFTDSDLIAIADGDTKELGKLNALKERI